MKISPGLLHTSLWKLKLGRLPQKVTVWLLLLLGTIKSWSLPQASCLFCQINEDVELNLMTFKKGNISAPPKLHQTVLIYVLERQRERMRKRMRERTSCAGSFPTCLQWGLKQGVKNTTRALRRVAGTQLLEPSPLPCKVCIRRKPTRGTNQRAANPSPGIWDTGMLNTRLYL